MLVIIGGINLPPFFNYCKMEVYNFSLDDYLINTGWVTKNKIWRKGNKSLSILNNGLMIALNNKIGIKHKHIVTCELPKDFVEAEIIFKKCRLNFLIKENGTDNKY